MPDVGEKERMPSIKNYHTLFKAIRLNYIFHRISVLKYPFAISYVNIVFGFRGDA